MRTGLAAAAVAAGVVLSAAPIATTPAASHDGAAAAFAAATEHRYRVVGRIRLALFWTRGSLVGSARMTARSTPEGQVLTFLLGSDPAVAPRKLNQWSYLREETGREHAAAFELRSLTGDELDERGVQEPPKSELFGASCDFVQDGGVRSLLTTVNGAGVTYRMFDNLLEHLARAPQWEERQLPRPAGITAGLLSAMEQIIRRTAAQATAVRGVAPVTYVYDGTLYDLSVRGAQSVGPMQFGATRFDWLTRIDFAVLNRRTRESSRFSAIFIPGASYALPVQILFQPKFWLRVELRLDDEADVPADPSADVSTVARIRSVCSAAAQRSTQTAIGGRRSAPRN